MDANGPQGLPRDSTEEDQQVPPIGGIPLSRTMTNSSISTVATVVPAFGKVVFELADLCRYIEPHPSLQAATVIATELYSEAGLVYKHRFLILELRRPGRKTVYLRLDRRRDETTFIVRFILNLGKTKANDEVHS
jgi:hypothetical protein